MSQTQSLMGIGFVNAFLHNAATVFVASDFNALGDHGVVEELVALVIPAVENFLDDVIAVDVLAHFFDSIA